MDDAIRRRLSLLRQLTARQRAVFKDLCLGRTREEIAARYETSVRTVDREIDAIAQAVAAGDPEYRALTATQRRLELRRCYKLLDYLEAAEASPPAEPPEPKPEPEPEPEPGTPAAIARFVADAAMVAPAAAVLTRRPAPTSERAGPARPMPVGAALGDVGWAVRRWWQPLALVALLAALAGTLGGLVAVHSLAAAGAPRGAAAAAIATPILTAAPQAPATATLGSVAAIADASTPAAAPSPATTPIAGPADLSGTVARDLPGTLLAPGAAVTSVLDAASRPRDVYAIELHAGDELRVQVEASDSSYAVRLGPPGVLPDGGPATQSLCVSRSSCTATVPIAASGTYPLVVAAYGSGGLRYTLRPATLPRPVPTGVADLTGRAASNLPGTRLALGTPVASILDPRTKGTDVYALALAAGQTLAADVSADGGDVAVLLLPPGTAPFARSPDWSRGTVLCSSSQSCHQTAPIAAAGAYALVVEAQEPGVQYTLRATARSRE